MAVELMEGLFVYLILLRMFCLGINDNEILKLYQHISHRKSITYGRAESTLCNLDTPSFPPVASRVDKFIALSKQQIFGSSACGMCVKVNVSGNGLLPKSETFVVNQECRGCKTDEIGFLDSRGGRWNISMQAVQCPVNEPIEYLLQRSNNYYIKLQVRNDRMPTTTLLMYQPIHNTWTQMSRTQDGFWEFPANDTRIDVPIQIPIRLLLYAPNGHVLYDEVNPPRMQYADVISGTGVQYSLDPTIPSA